MSLLERMIETRSLARQHAGAWMLEHWYVALGLIVAGVVWSWWKDNQ